jgi:protein O-mannosyl-transferase
LLICIVLAAATIAVYAPLKDYEFVNFDDGLYVTENALVQQGLTWEGLERAFAAPMNGFWHPLTILSHMLDVALFGLNPGAHHLVNLLFHIANTILLFLAINRMTGARWRSALVAALFALHPLHVESVAWVSERKDVLCTLFWMLTMLGYARYARMPSFRTYLLVLIPFILGLMAKPMLVTLPFVLLLLDFWPLARREKPIMLFREKVPLLALSAMASLVAWLAQANVGALSSWEIMPLAHRIQNAITSYGAYALKTFWPAALSVHYPHPAGFPVWKILAASAFLLLFTGFAAGLARKRPYLLVGWLWFIGTLVPVIGIVQIGSHAMADRYTYIPLIGLFLMVAWGIPDLMLQYRRARFFLGLSGAAVLILLAVATTLQAGFWKNSVTLLEHALLCNPEDAVAHNNLGSALARQGNLDRARNHFEEALRIHPHYWAPLNNIGNILCDQGRAEEALPYYEAGLKARPDKALVHNNLGAALASLGRFREAISHYQDALKISPDMADVMNNLGRAYQATGSIDQAIDHYRAALTRPSQQRYLFHSNLGKALGQKGLYDEAAKSFEEAIRLSPDKASAAYNGLATLYAGNQLFAKAMEMRRKAIRIDPENGEAHYRMAVEAYFLGEYGAAEEHCTRAMDLGFKEVEPEFLRRLAIAAGKAPPSQR